MVGHLKISQYNSVVYRLAIRQASIISRGVIEYSLYNTRKIKGHDFFYIFIAVFNCQAILAFNSLLSSYSRYALNFSVAQPRKIMPNILSRVGLIVF